MIKQVQIFVAATTEELQQKINEFCVDFFPEEIASIQIIRCESTKNTGEESWLGYIVYNKKGY